MLATKLTVSSAEPFIGGVREVKRFGLTYYVWFAISRKSRSVVASGEFMNPRYAHRAAERTVSNLNRLSQGV